MSLELIERQLREVLGLDAETLSRVALHAQLRRRMAACGVASQPAYAALLRNNPEEFRRFSDAIVVHETSFFRYPKSYELFSEEARTYRAQSGGAPFRVMCVACSTGEEPASVVMALRDLGYEPRDMRVDASDVSARAIDYAMTGRYRRRGVLRLPEEVRTRWFQEDGESYRLDREILDCIRYERVNALEADPARAGLRYEAVFCRNLLIYLTPAARDALIKRLIGHLAPGGLLFVGHAEVTAVRAFGLALAPPPDAFALRLAPAAVGRERSAFEPRAALPVGRLSPVVRTRAPRPPQPRPMAPVASQASLGSPLERAARLADAGNLDEARRILSEVMQQGSANADHYHLLAVIEGARGQEAATGEALRRALYLDPEHYPALVQLALLADGRGDREHARRTREKAARVRAAWDAAQQRAAQKKVEGGQRS